MGSSSSKPIPKPSIRFLKIGGKYKVKDEIITVCSFWSSKNLIVDEQNHYKLPADTSIYSGRKQYKLYQLRYVTNEKDYVDGFEIDNIFSNLVSLESVFSDKIKNLIKQDHSKYDSDIENYFKRVKLPEINIYYIEYNRFKRYNMIKDKLYGSNNYISVKAIILKEYCSTDSHDVNLKDLLKTDYDRYNNNNKYVYYIHQKYKNNFNENTPVESVSTSLSTPVSTSVSTSLSTPVSTSLSTPVSTSLSTPVSTPVSTSLSTPVSSPVEQPPQSMNGGKTKSKKKIKKSKKNLKKIKKN